MLVVIIVDIVVAAVVVKAATVRVLKLFLIDAAVAPAIAFPL